MDIQPGDVLEMKKEHPCGARRWEVLRVGMDFRLRCTGCGREVMLPRKKAEKALKKIISPAPSATPTTSVPSAACIRPRNFTCVP